MSKIVFAVLIFTSVFCFSIGACGQSPESENDPHLKGLQSLNVTDRLDAAIALSRAGGKKETLAFAGDLLNQYLDMEHMDSYSLKTSIYLIRALSQSRSMVHKPVLEKAQNHELRDIKKEAKKALEFIDGTSSEKKELAEQLIQYGHLGKSLRVYLSMAHSSAKYTREEGWAYLFTSRFVPNDKQKFENFPKDTTLFTPPVLLEELRSDDLKTKKTALQKIFYLGVDEIILHQEIEAQLIEGLALINNREPVDIDYVAWLTKGLAASGDSSKKSTIEKAIAADVSKLTFHASYALVMLERFADWYSKIDANSSLATLSDSELYHLILKAPYLQITDAALHFIINNRLENSKVAEICFNNFSQFYPYVRRNAREVRPSARMLQIMARSGDERYAKIMEEAVNYAPSRHVQKYASENLNELRKRINKE